MSIMDSMSELHEDRLRYLDLELAKAIESRNGVDKKAALALIAEENKKWEALCDED